MLQDSHAAVTPLRRSVAFAAFHETSCSVDGGPESDTTDDVVTPSYEAEELKCVEVRQPPLIKPHLCATFGTQQRSFARRSPWEHI